MLPDPNLRKTYEFNQNRHLPAGFFAEPDVLGTLLFLSDEQGAGFFKTGFWKHRQILRGF